MTPHAFNIALHVAAGATALLIGIVPILSSKGGKIHRIFGWLFVIAGTLVIGAAADGVLFWPQPMPLAAVTLTAGYQFIGALRALPRFRAGPSGVDAAMAIAALITAGVLLTLMGHGNRSWPPAVGYGTLGFLGCIIVYDLSRPLWAPTWRRVARPIDHGLKMTGAYFAMASAGLGNIARGWQPWSQFLPSAIGVLVMVVLLVSYIRRTRRGRAG